MSEHYFDTLSATCDAVQKVLDTGKVARQLPPSGIQIELVDSDWRAQLEREPISYGQRRAFNFEILAYKGKPTRKWFHVVIERLDSGSYELITYVL